MPNFNWWLENVLKIMGELEFTQKHRYSVDSQSNVLFTLGVKVAAVCDVCGKGPGFGHNISHSHRRTKRRFNPNIQTVRALVNNAPKRLNVCTGCIKANKVVRAN